MNWHQWHWWLLPASIAAGLAWSFILMCVIPPRITVRQYARGWKFLILPAVRLLRRIKESE